MVGLDRYLLGGGGRESLLGTPTPHTDRIEFVTIETKYRHWYLGNAAIAGGKLEKEQMTEEKILGTRMMPNSRPYEIEF